MTIDMIPILPVPKSGIGGDRGRARTPSFIQAAAALAAGVVVVVVVGLPSIATASPAARPNACLPDCQPRPLPSITVTVPAGYGPGGGWTSSQSTTSTSDAAGQHLDWTWADSNPVQKTKPIALKSLGYVLRIVGQGSVSCWAGGQILNVPVNFSAGANTSFSLASYCPQTAPYVYGGNMTFTGQAGGRSITEPATIEGAVFPPT